LSFILQHAPKDKEIFAFYIYYTKFEGVSQHNTLFALQMKVWKSF